MYDDTKPLILKTHIIDTYLFINKALENLNGKLLDTVDHFEILPTIDGEEKLPLSPAQLHELKELVRTAAWLDQFECETFFYATGVESVVPGNNHMNMGSSKNSNLFPKTNDWYTDVHNSKIHYVGWLMHERVSLAIVCWDFSFPLYSFFANQAYSSHSS